MAIYTNKYFISAFQNGDTFQKNMEASAELAVMLLGYGFQIMQCEGCYCGKTEVSYMVTADVGEDAELLIQIGEAFNQQCIGHIDNNNVFAIIGCKDGFNDVKEIGKVYEVHLPLEHVHGLEHYTSVNDTVFTTCDIKHLLH